MKFFYSKLIIFVLLLVTLAACGSESEADPNADATGESQKETLKMATSADFPPFESRDPEGNFEGFDIELAQLIADGLGYELEVEDMKFDGLIGALQSGRVDMVMAGMTTTEKRRKNVDFSVEYNHSGEMFISNPDSSIQSLEDLDGKTIGVQLGTIQEEGAEQISEEHGFDVKKVDDASILIQELNSGRIDAAYMDRSVAVGYVNEQGFAGFDDPTSSSPGMAVAFPKDSNLVDDVDEVLEKLKENGKLQELKDEWLTE